MFDPCGWVIYLEWAVSRFACWGRGAEFFPRMDKKRILASVVVFLILAVLVYLQYRHWQSFDWGTFWAQLHRINKWHVAHGITLIYIAYVLRAIRWKIFLRPVRPRCLAPSLWLPLGRQRVS